MLDFLRGIRSAVIDFFAIYVLVTIEKEKGKELRWQIASLTDELEITGRGGVEMAMMMMMLVDFGAVFAGFFCTYPRIRTIFGR